MKRRVATSHRRKDAITDTREERHETGTQTQRTSGAEFLQIEIAARLRVSTNNQAILSAGNNQARQSASSFFLSVNRQLFRRTFVVLRESMILGAAWQMVTVASGKA